MKLIVRRYGSNKQHTFDCLIMHLLEIVDGVLGFVIGLLTLGHYTFDGLSFWWISRCCKRDVKARGKK